MVPGLSGVSKIIGIGAGGIFAMLPLIVCYSATKRYGGRPVLGLAIGAVMIRHHYHQCQMLPLVQLSQ